LAYLLVRDAKETVVYSVVKCWLNSNW